MRERGRWGEVEGVRGGGRDMRKRIKRDPHLFTYMYTQHMHTHFLFCSIVCLLLLVCLVICFPACLTM